MPRGDHKPRRNHRDNSPDTGDRQANFSEFGTISLPSEHEPVPEEKRSENVTETAAALPDTRTMNLYKVKWNSKRRNSKLTDLFRFHIFGGQTEAFIVAEDPGQAQALLLETFKRIASEENPYVTTIELVASEDNLSVTPLIVSQRETQLQEEIDRLTNDIADLEKRNAEMWRLHMGTAWKPSDTIRKQNDHEPSSISWEYGGETVLKDDALMIPTIIPPGAVCRWPMEKSAKPKTEEPDYQVSPIIALHQPAVPDQSKTVEKTVKTECQSEQESSYVSYDA